MKFTATGRDLPLGALCILQREIPVSWKLMGATM